jgi:antitoxin PrlF
MGTTLTVKGQVTIPKRIRETLGLKPGSQVEFDIDEKGHILIRKAGKASQRGVRAGDRFDRARGRATVTWRTNDLMRLLRSG